MRPCIFLRLLINVCSHLLQRRHLHWQTRQKERRYTCTHTLNSNRSGACLICCFRGMFFFPLLLHRRYLSSSFCVFYLIRESSWGFVPIVMFDTKKWSFTSDPNLIGQIGSCIGQILPARRQNADWLFVTAFCFLHVKVFKIDDFVLSRFSVTWRAAFTFSFYLFSFLLFCGHFMSVIITPKI